MRAAKAFVSAAFAVGVLTGCAVDPSEQVFTINILNDSGRTVTVSTCDTSCAPTGVIDQVTLPPGVSTRRNESSEDAPNEYVVTDQAAHLRHCFQLRFTKKQPGLIVRLSGVTMSAC